MKSSLITTILLPLVLSAPFPARRDDHSQADIRAAHLHAYAQARGVSDSTSVISLNDASTLSSLVVFNPSATYSFTPHASASSAAAAQSNELLSSGESLTFNPTPTTTLSLLGNVSTAATSSSGGSSVSGSVTGVAAAANSTSNSTDSDTGSNGSSGDSSTSGADAVRGRSNLRLTGIGMSFGVCAIGLGWIGGMSLF
ncbi:hypothetical protein J008_01468 [Cryptococcus neoformans]|nr:hypothetical protein C368_02313 [Cryptococcus neoformans var. grubii 125.91]OXG53022.1 hypothetical protein C355_01587 [Cryptococcus neoformans var. grubii Th84]OXG85644.1 hypothetical protein C350_01487 [Cryptococcus neoformans var. grubii MW-RSA36]OXG87151.1 hypothetical protein C349_01578 [Cryptococcus neoformans var. grubii Br795]OXH15906.1 hypothetical protein J010_01460 [Cryptococcus neoformans var. grubii]OXL10557.1 hypothetical protein C348_01464 [Cryptococcus neoformans var. grubii